MAKKPPARNLIEKSFWNRLFGFDLLAGVDKARRRGGTVKWWTQSKEVIFAGVLQETRQIRRQVERQQTKKLCSIAKIALRKSRRQKLAETKRRRREAVDTMIKAIQGHKMSEDKP